MSDQHALWPYGPNHPKTIANNEFWRKQAQLPPEASIARTETWGQGRPQQHTTIAHPDHPLMGGPGWGPGVGGSPGDIAREEAQDRINNPHLWGQPEASIMQGPAQQWQVNPTGWKNDLLYRTTGAAGGNTLAQDIVGENVGAGSSPAALGFLKKVGSKLKEIWDRPIIAPTITKDEHDQLIQGGGGGVHNWQNTPHY